jgi:hypothetical protein
MRARYRCQRCGYHYRPEQLVVGPAFRRFPVCADRHACDARVAVREHDRAALRRSPRMLEP